MSNRHFLTAVTVAFITVSTLGVASGQGFFTERQLNSIKRQNSAAQFSVNSLQRNVINQSVPRFNTANVSQNLFSNSRAKPFASVNKNSSNVSPYLGLSSPFGGVQDYYNVVRPQLDQQRMRNQFTRQRNEDARATYQQAAHHHQLTQMAAQNPYETTGSEAFAPTGHATDRLNLGGVIQNMGGYFPPPSNAR